MSATTPSSRRSPASRRDGKAFVIRPSESVKAPIAVKDPEILERIYQVGRRDGEARVADVERYLA